MMSVGQLEQTEKAPVNCRTYKDVAERKFYVISPRKGAREYKGYSVGTRCV